MCYYALARVDWQIQDLNKERPIVVLIATFNSPSFFWMPCCFRLPNLKFCDLCRFRLPNLKFCDPCCFWLPCSRFCDPCRFRLPNSKFCDPCRFRLPFKGNCDPSVLAVGSAKKKAKKEKKVVAVLGGSRYKARMERIRAVLIRIRKLLALNMRTTIKRGYQETHYGKH